uniref:uncharacterized protein LOC117609859 isoform X2 n=1 Tax=Osmia lignaria TaxID=473952 RepID=UPI0014784B17|nr:uncharacterized protein LOC117609859 isoform X2 [Osmia lignaria]
MTLAFRLLPPNRRSKKRAFSKAFVSIKIRDPDSKEISWVPSETILLTFEGSVVPEKIQVFGILNKNIEPYIERVRTCVNCGGYGHTASRCRGPTICFKCGEHKKDEQHSCDAPTGCLHCKGDHSTFHPDCQTMIFNQEVNPTLAFYDVSIYEALTQTRKKLGLVKQRPPRQSSANSSNPSSFPSLPPSTSKKEYTLRTIGGIQKERPASQWNNNILKTYSKNNAIVGSSSSIISLPLESPQKESSSAKLASHSSKPSTSSHTNRETTQQNSSLKSKSLPTSKFLVKNISSSSISKNK